MKLIIDDMRLSVSLSCVLFELRAFFVTLHMRALFSFVAFVRFFVLYGLRPVTLVHNIA
jgi:hypothetical protein